MAQRDLVPFRDDLPNSKMEIGKRSSEQASLAH